MFEELRQSIKELIALYEAVKADNAELRSQISSLKSKTEADKEQIIELNKEIDRLKLKAAFTASSGEVKGTKEAKEKVDRLIREIDKCISLMASSER